MRMLVLYGNEDGEPMAAMVECPDEIGLDQLDLKKLPDFNDGCTLHVVEMPGPYNDDAGTLFVPTVTDGYGEETAMQFVHVSVVLEGSEADRG